MVEHRDDPMRLWVGTWQPEPVGGRRRAEASDRAAPHERGDADASPGSAGETTTVRSLL